MRRSMVDRAIYFISTLSHSIEEVVEVIDKLNHQEVKAVLAAFNLYDPERSTNMGAGIAIGYAHTLRQAQPVKVDLEDISMLLRVIKKDGYDPGMARLVEEVVPQLIAQVKHLSTATPKGKQWQFWQVLECYNKKIFRREEILRSIAADAAHGEPPDDNTIKLLGEAEYWLKQFDQATCVSSFDIHI